MGLQHKETGLPDQLPPLKRRGAQINPQSRFEATCLETDLEQCEWDEDFAAASRSVPTTFMRDESRSILTKNDSPDVGFSYSVNPYRGCEHGCSYCYARPSHETLGFNAGSDFEAKIMVKHRAPELLAQALSAPKWQPRVIAMSGVTDCYQPAERRFKLTRRCLAVLLDYRNPAAIITKNVLLLRDLALLKEMAERQLIKVYITVTSLDPQLALTMEPRTPTPAARLRAVKTLADAGVPVGVMIAPIVPGLTDTEMPAILAAAAAAGARNAHYTLLRLPLNVEPIFLDWLHRAYPERENKVMSLIRSMRHGKMNSAKFGERMQGAGTYADHLRRTFGVFSKKFGLNGDGEPLDTTQFRRVTPFGVQGELFHSGEC